VNKIDRIVGELRRFGPLAGEDEYLLRRIASHVTEHQTAAGDVLIRERETARAVHLLITGRVAVTIGEALVADIGPGSILGEMAMLDHSASAATVTVVEPGLVLTVTSQGFDALLDSQAASRAISSGLARRVRHLEGLDNPS
jgi:CRP-like cAMP-binding protein